MKLGEGLTSKIILTGKPLLINKDVHQEASVLGISRIGVPAASYLGVPIPVSDEIIGVLSIQSTEEQNRFAEKDKNLLVTIAANVGVAIRKARLYEEVKQANTEADAARKTAEEANAAKSAFLSTVSHELRTPLTSVLGFAKIIRKRLDEKIFPAVDRKDPKTEKTGPLTDLPRRLRCAGRNRLDRADQFIHRLVEGAEEGRRIQADPECHDDQWNERGPLSPVHILQMLIGRVIQLAEHRSLVEPEHVCRSKHDACASGNRPPEVLLKRTGHDRELSNESVQQRQPDRRHRHDQENDGVCRHDVRQSSQLRNLARVPSLIDDAHDKEERTGRNSVVDLLDDAAVQAVRVKRKHPKHHEAHVAD